MEDKIIEGVSQSTGFSPLEIVLMSAVAILFTILFKFAIKVVQAVSNNTQAMNDLKQSTKDSTTAILSAMPKNRK